MKLFKILLVYCFLFSFSDSYAQLVGKVISITDGDTFTMLVDNEQIKVRLHGIDCPEKSQPYGNVAKEFLSSSVFGKVVSVKKLDVDRYGRTIGMVTVDGVNVNEKLLSEGLAWHYKYFDKNGAWTKLEDVARKEKKGLWKDSNPIPPWDWRKQKSN